MGYNHRMPRNQNHTGAALINPAGCRMKPPVSAQLAVKGYHGVENFYTYGRILCCRSLFPPICTEQGETRTASIPRSPSTAPSPAPCHPNGTCRAGINAGRAENTIRGLQRALPEPCRSRRDSWGRPSSIADSRCSDQHRPTDEVQASGRGCGSCSRGS